MWISLAAIILRNRLAFLGVILGITIFMAYHARQVEIEYEYAQMLPKSDTTYIRFQEFKQLFGEDANAMIIGIQDDNFFELEEFNDWQQLRKELLKLKGVNHVLSVGDAIDIIKNKEEKRFETRPIFPDHIETQAELDSLANIFTQRPIYKKLVYNDTSDVYLMAITMAKNMINSVEREVLIANVEQLIDDFGEKHHTKIYYSGLPYTRTKIATLMKSEIGLFVLYTAIITSIILFFFFRSFKVVFFSMLIVGIGVVWALGSIHLFGFRITILSGMVPPLLIVIGIPNSVYLLNKYHKEFKIHGNQIKALHRIIHRVGNATFLTNLTTAAGFATFIITSNRVLVEFGIISSLNIMGVFFLSISLIPIFFSFVKKPKARHIAHLDKKLLLNAVKTLVYIVERKRNYVYILILALTTVAIFGLVRIHSTGYIIDDIPKDDIIYTDLKFLEKHFGGVMPMEITIDAKRPRSIMRVPMMQKMEQFEQKLEEYDELSPVFSVIDGVKFAKQAFYNGSPNKFSLPNNQERGFIFSYLQNTKADTDMLDNYMDSTQQIARMSMRVADIGTYDMMDLAANLQKEADSIFNPEQYDVNITGSSIVFTKGTTYLVSNLFTSLMLAVGLISLFMAWMFRSARMVVVSLLPNLLPLLFTAGIMGFSGIPIKPSTVLVFSIAFGISVDNAIHFLAKYRQEIIINQFDIHKSVINALSETGVSIMYTAIILFFGFSVFTLSEFGGTQALGLLVSITLLFAMVANLLLLPSMLLSLRNSITTESFKKQNAIDEDLIDLKS